MKKKHRHARRRDWPRELTLLDLIPQEEIVIEITVIRVSW
jgi:hypothetical protein